MVKIFFNFMVVFLGKIENSIVGLDSPPYTKSWILDFTRDVNWILPLM